MYTVPFIKVDSVYKPVQDIPTIIAVLKHKVGVQAGKLSRDGVLIGVSCDKVHNVREYFISDRVCKCITASKQHLRSESGMHYLYEQLKLDIKALVKHLGGIIRGAIGTAAAPAVDRDVANTRREYMM